ncbi:MAG: RNase adapter RapZ [Pseudomonadota bacterium]
MSAEYLVQHFDSLLLVTGISGAGKSTAMQLLSDTGYYVVDNLPVPLLGNLLKFSEGAEARFRKTALLLDIDSAENQKLLTPLLDNRSSTARNVKLIFLDAETSVVVRRYSETRRPHPAFDPDQDDSIQDAIFRERERLQPIKERADLVLDTSDCTVHELKRRLREFLRTLGVKYGSYGLRVNFLSFGFKHGAPIDCDLIADVRFLTNPHFVESLRTLTGQDKAVRDYVFQSPDASEFIKRYSDLLRFLLPRYQLEGKAYVNIGIGCTGGQHRSVAIAEALYTTMVEEPYLISVRHRDLR